MDFSGFLSRKDKDDFLNNIDINYNKIDMDIASYLYGKQQATEAEAKSIWIIRICSENFQLNNNDIVNSLAVNFKGRK